MSDKILLSEDELKSLFGDKTTDNNSQDEANLEEFIILKQAVNSSVSKVKSTLSSKLNEEVECIISEPEIINGLQIPEGQENYVVDSDFTNNGSCLHYFTYPSEVAFNFAKQYSGLDDITNSLDEIRPHIYEITELILQDIASQLERGFQARLNEVIHTNNINEINANSRFIRFTWKVGAAQFYEFFHISVLDLLQSDYNEKNQPTQDEETKATPFDGENDNLTDTKSDLSDTAEGISSLFDDNSNSNEASSPFSSFLGSTSNDQSESIASLGEELLKDSQSVSNVSLPDLGESSASSNVVKKEMNILYGVSMELTVELGNARMRLEEILELNRGSIIELRKLAGEPLDIKINNKLIAKGEVVVIDENFGVRIIEIISPKDRMKEMN